ncbi:MAG: DUF1343 domain-containing protein [Alphaproteobacteria bacterium]|nr:DUF1343 domain-containing protein [Alphaproteobacteria bacterium]
MKSMPFQLPLTGIDHLLKNEALLDSLSRKRVGLLTNQSALTQNYQPSAYALSAKIGRALTCILTPEHGWSGQIAEGVKVGDGFDSSLKVPLFSLYGGNKAFKEMRIDTLLIDLQDTGLRCYTYTASCAQVMEAIEKIDIIVCDRPNPLGSQRRGPNLDLTYRSFLAYLDVPFQHGQTTGELLSTFNTTKGKHSLTIMPCQHDHRPYQYPWIPPSPNLPSWDSVLLYPALVLLEGTNISEGRGTSLPFTCLGAPGLNHYELVDVVNAVPGIRARPLTFTPQSGKHAGVECHGVHLLIVDYQQLDAFSLGLKFLTFLRKNYSEFEWLEAEEKGYFIDFLVGTDKVRKAIDEETLPESSLAVL